MPYTPGNKVALKSDIKCRGSVVSRADYECKPEMYNIAWVGGGTYMYPIYMLIPEAEANEIEKETAEKIAVKFKELSKEKPEEIKSAK